MNKISAIIRFIIITLSSITISFGQIRWKDHNPYEFYGPTYLQFISDSVGWAMPYSDPYPENSALFKTTDGGKNWLCTSEFEPVPFRPQRPFNFIDSNIGYYFSNLINDSNWKIFKTTNGGTYWSHISSLPLYAIKNSFFLSETVGWISRNPADLFKTTDGGSNWTLMQTFSNYYHSQSYPVFFDENTGLFLITFSTPSSHLYKTIDGQLWDSVYSWSNRVYSVSFTNKNLGYLIYNKYIMKTTNGGSHWFFVNVPGNGDVDLVQTVNDSVVVATGFTGYPQYITKVYISTNSGLNWNVNSISGSYTVAPKAIECIDENTIFLSCYNYVYKITNLGNDWEKLAIGPTHNLESIIDVPGGKPFAVGWKQDPQSLQYESAIISHHPLWRTISLFAEQKLKCITAKNTTEIFIGGYDYSNGGKSIIYKCDNEGNNPEVKYNSSGQIVNSIHFFNEQNGIAVGGQGMMLKTSDGGNSWIQETSITNEDLNTIKFSSQLGFIGGRNGLLLRTSDGGMSWTNINPGTNKEVKSILIHTQSKIWMVGKDGLIMRSDDGGMNWWVLISASEEYDLNSIAAMSQNHIGIYGRKKSDNSPFIMETHDGGSAWVYEKSSADLQSINFVYPMGTKAWAVGDFGTILHSAVWFTPVELSSFTASSSKNTVQLTWSTASELNNYGFEIERKDNKTDLPDGKAGWRTIGFREGKGTTTEQQYYNFTDDLFGVNSHKLYYRLKQIDYDGQFEYSNVLEVEVTPLTFALHQNYPNPFNPSTKISWQSPVSSHQTLKVYDVLGREVATLVDEYKEAGYHEVEFQLAVGNRQYASGIYYYQLKAGSYVQTKKMLLLK